MATKVAVLPLGGLKLILGPGVFTVIDLHRMDVPLFWKELTPCDPLYFSMDTRNWFLPLIGPISSASGRLEVSLCLSGTTRDNALGGGGGGHIVECSGICRFCQAR
eukprot:1153563-Pelagomonas_calceolata.AAC.1